MTEYEIGTTLKFLGEPHPTTGALRHLGDADVAPAEGCVREPLIVGSVGTVVALVAAHEDGAGTHEADCTVIQFTEPLRNISFEADQLAAWFEVSS